MTTSPKAEPEYLEEALQQVLDQIMTIFIKKHLDYGKDNILDTGEMGILFRINDKVKRLQHLASQNKKPTNESINETWIDIATYAVIAIILRQGYFEELNLSPKAKQSLNSEADQSS